MENENSRSKYTKLTHTFGSLTLEAARLGKSFRKHLLANKEFAVAVDAWRLANTILQPLFDHSPVFGSIMVSVAKQLLVSSTAGLAKRVTLGALLSIMDMITDAGVIKTYQASGNTSEANSLIAMIGSSLAAQLLSTYVQNKKKSNGLILREFASIVTFLKPAVDAYRVATGKDDKDATMSPLLEMTMGKMIELALESIPGGLLQAYMFINSPEKTMFLLVSILISTLTTGFASAMISYDMDISVANRKEVPLFYGYIKDSNTERGITFVLLFLLASLHNLSRTIGTALLLSVSKELTFGIILAELVCYHIYKVARRDYVTWVVGLEGWVKYSCAFVMHTLFKIIVDNTGE